METVARHPARLGVRRLSVHFGRTVDLVVAEPVRAVLAPPPALLGDLILANVGVGQALVVYKHLEITVLRVQRQRELHLDFPLVGPPHALCLNLVLGVPPETALLPLAGVALRHGRVLELELDFRRLLARRVTIEVGVPASQKPQARVSPPTA